MELSKVNYLEYCKFHPQKFNEYYITELKEFLCEICKDKALKLG